LEIFPEYPDLPEAEKEVVSAVLQAPRRSHSDFPAQNQAPGKALLYAEAIAKPLPTYREFSLLFGVHLPGRALVLLDSLPGALGRREVQRVSTHLFQFMKS
jgi:hypothetical protein